MRALLVTLVTVTLVACTGLPSLSVTPVSADLQVGGTRRTEQAEDNMVKLDTGTTHSVRAAEVVQNYTEEAPPWLILLCTLFAGLALPSPLSSWGSYRERRRLEKINASLLQKLYESSPTTSTTRHAGSLD